MAVLFIFSGLAKSINPFGLSIQLGDYLTVMGMPFLKPLAPLGGILLPTLELLLGIMLLLGLSRKISAWGTLLSMSFFTLLTLWIAIYNPVTDCGCFGDLVKLTNWETFSKNIVLMPFAIALFMSRGKWQSTNRLLYIIAVPASCALALYSWFNLPIVDATPYKVGVNIAQAMSTPADAPQAESHTILIYKNLSDGTLHEFEIDDTTWQDDSKWEYVDTKTTIIAEGYTPSIKSLPMLDASGQDFSQGVLNQTGRVTIVVTNDFESLDKSAVNSLSGRVIVLISSPIPAVSPFTNAELYNSDYSVISTIIQNKNGGAITLENGVIIQKAVMNDLF